MAFHHHHHHHHHHSGEEDQPFPPPAHNPYGRPINEYAPPPPALGYGPPCPGPAPPCAGAPGHHHLPHYPAPPPAYAHHVSHENLGGSGAVSRQATVRIFTRAEDNYSLSIRNGKVVLVPANPRDEYQHWIKDMKFSTKVKDQEGFPSFALVNKVTGEAIKHSIGATHPVRLIKYNPDYLDESILWTESRDTGEGFRCIRMVNNIGLNFDAFHGDEDHGGVSDGTIVVLWEWLKGKNQRWKIVPYCKFSDSHYFISFQHRSFQSLGTYSQLVVVVFRIKAIMISAAYILICSSPFQNQPKLFSLHLL